MSNISSNSLFHFTPTIEILTSILKNNFFPRYCWEEIELSSERNKGRFESGLPMVSFCDISLSQINNHIDIYGNYGIGMSKEWGIKNKLNPVFYITKDSKAANSISGLAETTENLLGKTSEDLSLPVLDYFLEFSFFQKTYTGKFVKNGKTHNDYKFYNEREWRYVPNVNMKSNATMSISRKMFSDHDFVNKANEKLKDFALKFTPSDIKYIFVKSEDEIHPMIEKLREIKETNFTQKEIDILTSKILTTEQINEDF